MLLKMRDNQADIHTNLNIILMKDLIIIIINININIKIKIKIKIRASNIKDIKMTIETLNIIIIK